MEKKIYRPIKSAEQKCSNEDDSFVKKYFRSVKGTAGSTYEPAEEPAGK